MSNTSLFDALSIQKMASGHICLNLSERVSWETFPNFVKQVLKKFNGKIKEQIDTPVIRLWKISANGSVLDFVFDDFPLMVSLESSDNEGDLLIEKLYHNFSAINEAP